MKIFWELSLGSLNSDVGVPIGYFSYPFEIYGHVLFYFFTKIKKLVFERLDNKYLLLPWGAIESMLKNLDDIVFPVFLIMWIGDSIKEDIGDRVFKFEKGSAEGVDWNLSEVDSISFFD